MRLSQSLTCGLSMCLLRPSVRPLWRAPATFRNLVFALPYFPVPIAK